MPARLDIWGDRAQVVSHFGLVASHAHPVGAILCGLDGLFEITHAGRSAWVPSVYIPPGARHSLDVHQQRLAVIYFAPGRLELSRFARARNFNPNELHPIRNDQTIRRYAHACWDEEILDQDVQSELSKLLGGPPPTRITEDPRVQRLFEATATPTRRQAYSLEADAQGTPAQGRFLIDPGQEPAPGAQDRAKILGVAASRARQILRRDLGASWQHLRRWQRMREVSSRVAAGHTLTQAAHSLGFSDSSQLSRDFRASFGVAPTQVYRAARVVVHPDVSPDSGLKAHEPQIPGCRSTARSS